MVSHRRIGQLAHPKFKCAQVARAMKAHAYVRAQSLGRVQLCNPRDCSSPGSSAREISQARILERVTSSSSRGLPDPGRSNPHLPCLQHWQLCSLPLSHLGSPYNGILLGHERSNNAICRNIDGDYHSKWSKLDKDKYTKSFICGI